MQKIAVIGNGMVGSQVKAWFQCPSYDKDPAKSDGWSAVEDAGIFFVCVPTPYRGNEYDLSFLEEAIRRIPDGKIVVIKSTVNPGTTDYFQEKYPNKVVMFNPEFLTELNAREDFFKPDMQILGITHKGYEIASKIMLMLPPAPVMRIVSPIDAEWVKKLRNSFYAMKVVFFNQMYDIMEGTPADYETIRSIVVEDPRVGNSHSFVFHKGYRGYGGACLPKDTNALIDYARKLGKSSELLEKTRELNEKYAMSGHGK